MPSEALRDEVYARILACAQWLRREMVRRASEANLTLTDFLALRHLIREDCAFAPTDIARVLACSRGNATKVVARLEKAHYVRIHNDPFSPRHKSVCVTSHGRAAYERALRNVDVLDRFARFSDEEMRELHRLLGRVSARIPMFRLGA